MQIIQLNYTGRGDLAGLKVIKQAFPVLSLVPKEVRYPFSFLLGIFLFLSPQSRKNENKREDACILHDKNIDFSMVHYKTKIPSPHEKQTFVHRT